MDYWPCIFALLQQPILETLCLPWCLSVIYSCFFIDGVRRFQSAIAHMTMVLTDSTYLVKHQLPCLVNAARWGNIMMWIRAGCEYPHAPPAPLNLCSLSTLIISRPSLWNSASASINYMRTLQPSSSAYFSSSIPSIPIIASTLLWRRMYPHDAPVGSCVSLSVSLW